MCATSVLRLYVLHVVKKCKKKPGELIQHGSLAVFSSWMICHTGGIARLMVLFLCTIWVHYYGFSIITCNASSKHLMVSILICILHVGVNHHTCHRLKCRVSSLLREVVNLSVEATAGKDTGSSLIGANSWISASGWKFPGGALETGWGGGYGLWYLGIWFFNLVSWTGGWTFRL